MTYTLLSISRNTPAPKEHLLTFGVGEPVIIPAVSEIADPETNQIVRAAIPESKYWGHRVRNVLLRDVDASLSDSKLESLAREELP